MLTGLPPIPDLPGAVTDALQGRHLTRALSDPGSVTSRQPDESLPAWQARAVRLTVFPMVRAAEREGLLNDLAAAFGSLLDELGSPGRDQAAASAACLTLDELLHAIEVVDAHLDSAGAPEYLAQPLARRWVRVTKVCEEAGEVWKALSKMTGENPRKGVCGTEAELLEELGDTASAAMCAIQHLTKDTARTWAVVSAALVKARERVAAQTAGGCGAGGDQPCQ